MEGDSSLSGTRRTIESVRVWYERLFRVFPKVQFQIEETIIKGMPWNTKIVNRFTVNIRLADGYAYSNNVAQFIDLKWGKITSMHLYEDTKKLADGLERQLKSGIKEAGLKPIEDSK